MNAWLFQAKNNHNYFKAHKQWKNTKFFWTKCFHFQNSRNTKVPLLVLANNHWSNWLTTHPPNSNHVYFRLTICTSAAVQCILVHSFTVPSILPSHDFTRGRPLDTGNIISFKMWGGSSTSYWCLWVLTLQSMLGGYQCCRSTCCLHLQGSHLPWRWTSTLLQNSGITCQTSWSHKPEDHNMILYIYIYIYIYMWYKYRLQTRHAFFKCVT